MGQSYNRQRRSPMIALYRSYASRCHRRHAGNRAGVCAACWTWTVQQSGPEMNGAIALLIFVTLQRFVEFVWDWQNTQRLRASGAVEFGGLHYPAMILVHAGWLAGLWVLGFDHEVVPAYLAAFLALEIGRYWVLATL